MMSIVTPERTRPARWSAVVVAAGLLLSLLNVPHTVHAAIQGCRSDPVLVVNGAIVDVVSTLSTPANAVQELDYAITVPAGSLIGQTTLTVGLGFPEKVTYTFSAAQPWGTIRIAATVRTQAGVQPFPTTVTATSPLSLLMGTASANGISTSVVMLTVSHLLML